MVEVVLGFGSVADGVVATSTPSHQAAVACKLIVVFVFCYRLFICSCVGCRVVECGFRAAVLASES